LDQERRTNIKVGVTVLVGIVVLLAGIAWAKGWRFGAQGHIVRAVFPTAGGLEVGDPVTINGVKRGTVDEIESRTSDVLVKLKFPGKIDLREDAQANIMMLELMGGKKVELLSGSSPMKLGDSSIIRGSYSGDIGTLVAMVTSLSETVRSITGRADTLLASLNDFLADGSFKSNVTVTLQDARKTLANFNTTAARLNQILNENEGPLKRTLAQAESATKELTSVLNENRPGLRSFLDSSQVAVADARVAMIRANTLLVHLDSMFNSSSSQNSLLHRLTQDKDFADRLDSTLISLNKFIEQVRLQGLDANVRFFQSSKPLP